MRKTGITCTLLFSLIILTSSCAKKQTNYSSLASEGAYPQILSQSIVSFKKDYSTDELLWMAISYHESGFTFEAAKALELYFDLVYEADIALEARQLALRIPVVPLSVEQGRILDSLQMLDRGLATAYYQALLVQGREAEANDIFARYLSDTIAPYAYAEILVRSGSELSLLTDVLNKLSIEDRILIIAKASLEENSAERAAQLAEIIAVYETHSLDEASLQLLYESLWRLYSQANIRVLANKYHTLAQRVQ